MSKKLMHICGNHFRFCATSALQTKLWKTQMQQKIHKRSCTTVWKLLC